MLVYLFILGKRVTQQPRRLRSLDKAAYHCKKKPNPYKERTKTRHLKLVTLAGSLPPPLGSYRPELIQTASQPSIFLTTAIWSKQMTMWLSLRGPCKHRRSNRPSHVFKRLTKPLLLRLHPERWNRRNGEIRSGNPSPTAIEAITELKAYPDKRKRRHFL